MITYLSKWFALSVPRCTLPSYRHYSKIGIVGAPFDKGQRREGASGAPSALRQAGIIKYLTDLGCDVKDYGDVEYELDNVNHALYSLPHMKNVIGFNKMLSKNVSEVINDGRVCLTLGGDHSIGIGTVHGALKARPNTSILWVDAHADINTPQTSASKNLHGMPVSFNLLEMSEYQMKFPGFDWHTPMISAKNIAFIGLRDVDPYERLIIDKFGICALSMEEVHNMGIKEAVKYAMDRIDPENNRHLHVSFDIDALDPLEAPSTGTPVRGGLTLREGMDLLRSVFRTGRLSAIDIVEVNTRLGSESDAQKTVQAALHLVAAAFGFYAGGKAPANTSEIPRFLDN